MSTIKKDPDDWKNELSPDAYHVTREGGTEPAFSGAYNTCEETGTYQCVCCGNELFLSRDKYDSGSGWPSFSKPADPDQVRLQVDRRYGVRQIEVICRACDAHLGHVFDDGPRPTGKRFCINSVSLKLAPEEDV